MFYKNLKFSKPFKNRPFFYTNFVQTVDGKVAVRKPGYWPIGSQADHKVLQELRAYADCLIHGSNLGREFGAQTQESLKSPKFTKLRKSLSKDEELPYYIVTTKPSSFPKFGANIVGPDIKELVIEFKRMGFKHILVEGGPTLLGSFLKEDLIDEVFLTIAPKIYGTNETTKNLVEGQLFPLSQIKHLKLISVKKIKDELFLRYRIAK